MLSASTLVKRFRTPEVLTVLDGVSLDVQIGDTVAIQGRSGEGKSTLLHLLGTLDFPDSGSITIRGEKVTPQNAPALRNECIGFIFQAYNLLEDLTVLENVLLPLRIARKPALREWGLHLLEKVGLAARAHFPAKLLSGGERQRVAIARALCNSPLFILADEPTGNLDRAHSQAIGELLVSLKTTLLLVTHDPELASLCSRRYKLESGHLT